MAHGKGTIGDVLSLVQSRVAELASRLADDPDERFQALPVDFREQELPTFARREYLLTIRLLRENRKPAEQDLAATRTMAALRANEGTPLALVVHNWNRGLMLLWDECTRAADEVGCDSLAELHRALLELQDARLSAVVDAYQLEREAIERERGGARYALAEALLGGETGAGDGSRFGVRIASHYAVIAVRFSRRGAEFDCTKANALIASRRKLREILRVFPDRETPALPMLDAAGGFILVPRPEANSAEPMEHEARQMLARIRQHAGVEVIGGFVEATRRQELPGSQLLASEILKLSVRLRRSPGLYVLDDVLLVYQLTRPGPARERLLATLRPLREHPELLHTLDTYFRHDLDRARTARALDVHVNTVNNRVNRGTELLGVDCNRTDDLLLLGNALLLHRVM